MAKITRKKEQPGYSIYNCDPGDARFRVPRPPNKQGITSLIGFLVNDDENAFLTRDYGDAIDLADRLGVEPEEIEGKEPFNPSASEIQAKLDADDEFARMQLKIRSKKERRKHALTQAPHQWLRMRSDRIKDSADELMARPPRRQMVMFIADKEHSLEASGRTV